MQVKNNVHPTCCSDTVLRLELPNSYLSHGTCKELKRKCSVMDGPMACEDKCSLTLGTGHYMSSATARTTGSSAIGTDGDSSVDNGLDISLQLGNEKYCSPKKSSTTLPMSNISLELSLSTAPADSSLTCVSLSSISLEDNFQATVNGKTILVDEGSTSSRWKTGNAVALWHAMRNGQIGFNLNQVPGKADPVSIVSNFPSPMVDTPRKRFSTTKTCRVDGCEKGARGSSGRCIGHGGGKRCQKAGCNKGAEGKTNFCKGHGGGRRCQHPECNKSAEGRTNYCIGHGGGRRCAHEGCPRASRGKSGLCIKHGGGKRCQRENCPRSAEGLSGFCISHGGGRRCKFPQCTKGAQGGTMLCKAHGGGKRCTAFGCTKGAEGSTLFCKGHGGGKRCTFQGGEDACPRSVHGGTLYCVAHGGGKRCASVGCRSSARGKTMHCVRHGGGNRCKFSGCGKSAQGGTDFCKAHGGGKRCNWGNLGFEFSGQSGFPCNRTPTGKTGLCATHLALCNDEQVHGGGTLGILGLAIHDVKPRKPEKMKDIIVADELMRSSSIDVQLQGWKGLSFSGYPQTGFTMQVPPPAAPEGRVHGGNLLAMLGSSSSVSPSTSTGSI
ncbi:hypothetical protein ACHQM5_000441 [Ranunculus cassubicifolius]